MTPKVVYSGSNEANQQRPRFIGLLNFSQNSQFNQIVKKIVGMRENDLTVSFFRVKISRANHTGPQFAIFVCVYNELHKKN
jgi:hypothetical protein